MGYLEKEELIGVSTTLQLGSIYSIVNAYIKKHTKMCVTLAMPFIINGTL